MGTGHVATKVTSELAPDLLRTTCRFRVFLPQSGNFGGSEVLGCRYVAGTKLRQRAFWAIAAIGLGGWGIQALGSRVFRGLGLRDSGFRVLRFRGV